MQKIKGGYYMKARKVELSAVAHMPPCTREVWDYLLAKANHSEKKYAGFTVKRGQLFRSYSDILNALHWMVGWRKETYNESQMKNAMAQLRTAHMIETKKELGGVLITVLNYDFYQNPENYERTTKDTNEETKERTIEKPSCPDTNKNEKNEEELKEKTIYDQNFEKFWIEYPGHRKVGKKKAHAIWKKMTSEDKHKAINALPHHIKSERWTKQNGEFIPHPTTWLSQGRWEDDVKTAYKPPEKKNVNCPNCYEPPGKHAAWCPNQKKA